MSFDGLKFDQLLNKYKEAWKAPDGRPDLPYVEIMKLLSDAITEAKIETARNWAWWKDGTQYVGCGVKTLKDAIEEIKKEAIW